MFRLVAACMVACLSTGCASIVSGQNQSVSVTTRSQGVDVAGASCSLTNDKGQWYATTPGSVTVHRSFNDLAVNCTHDGLDGGVTMAKSSTKGMAFGNILFGGLIGAGVDMASGAAYDYPGVIQIDLGPPRAALPTKASAPALAGSEEMGRPAATQLAAPISTTIQLPLGEYASNAERIARAIACSATPRLVAKGGGFETYSVACSITDPVILRCDSASCREMK